MRFLAVIGGLAIIAGVFAGGYFFGGFYDIAASRPDSAPIAAALVRVRNASIAHHATAEPPASLASPDTLRQGAAAFAAQGCAGCHGGPGVGWIKYTEGMNPGPPDLKEAAARLSVAEVFWVAKHGIRMTAMPSFGKIGVKDDVLWKIAAFVKALPKVTPAQYAAWTAKP